MENSKKKLTAERAIQILAKGGIMVNKEQAEGILDMLNKFANIALSTRLKR